MSKQIDSKVVEMRFDNSQFERNVQTSMSTLDKLKQSLQFKGAEKGFDNLSSSAKKVDMTPLGKGLETVQAKFSALEVMGVTALANITNSVVNSAKQWVNSLTIAPIKDGFSEYEMTLNAVQTTMAGTGKTAEEVEKQLKRLDEYADKTVYSTADMLNNLPKFTNAGVELEKATTAMIGIANATALAGGDAGKASIAFYNLGQAIGTGYLTRMDYNSINNAGIATMEWKNQMIEAAIAQGTLTKVGENSYKAGKKTYTLQQLFIDGLQEQWATTDVMMKVFGDYGDTTTEIGEKAQASAQNIKTFTMMMDSLKATAGTGWKDTWQLIFGDLGAATKFWTGLNNFISGIIEGMADARNKLLEGALGKTFTKLADKINGVLGPAKKASETVKGATTAVKDLGKVVDKVILGSFGNGKDRVDALTKAGYNYYEVQNKVNEKLGNSFRYTTELTDAQGKLTDAQKDAATSQKKLTKEDAKRLEQLTDMSDAQLENMGYTKDQIEALRELRTEADKLGLPVSEFINQLDELSGRTILINSFKNIGQGLVKVFTSLKDAWVDVFPPATADQLYNVIAGFHKLTTHLVVGDETADKLTRTFKGLFAALDIILTIVGGPIKIAFKLLTKILGAFDLDILDVTAAIGDAIVGFNDWIDKVLDFTKIFEKIEPVLSDCIKSVQGWIDDMKTKFSNFGSNIIEGFQNGLSGGLGGIWDAIVNIGKNILEKFKKILGINSPSKETEAMGKDLIQGLLNGISAAFWVLSAFITKMPLLNVIAALASAASVMMSDIGAKILDGIKKVLGINSPSTEMFEIGKNIIEGLVNGLKAGFSIVADIAKNLGSTLVDSFKNLNWGAIAAGMRSIAAFFPKLNILNAFAHVATYAGAVGADTISGLVKGLGDGAGKIISVMGQIGKTIIDSICKVLGINSPSKVFMAIGGFLISGLVAGLVSDSDGVIGALSDICKNMFTFLKDAFIGLLNFIKGISFGEVLVVALTAGVVVAIKKTLDIVDAFGDAARGFGKAASGAGDLMKAFANKIDPKKNKFEQVSENMLKMAIAIGILAGSVYILAQLKPGQLWSAVGAVTALALVIGGLAIAMDKLKVKGSDFGKVTMLVTGVAIALLVLSRVMKTIAKMEWGELGKAAAGVAGLMVFLSTLMLITKIGNSKKIGVMLIQIAGAMWILTRIGKTLAQMEWSELGKAAAGLGGLVGIMALLMLVSKIGNSKKIGSMLLKMAGALAILTLVVKMLAKMSWGDMGKAAVGLAGLLGVISLMMLITKIGNFKKVGSMLLQMAGAIAILALTARLIAGMEWGEMGKAAVGLLGLTAIIAGLIAATRLAGGNSLKGVGVTLIAAASAIAILAAVCVLLGMVDPNRLQQGVTAVTVLGTLMALLMAATANAQKCVGNMVAASIAIAVMAGAVAGLSFIDPGKLAGATTALTILMGMFALIIYSSGTVNSSIGVIITMTVALAVMAGALWLIASLPTGAALPAAGALAIVMLALVGALLIVSKVQNVSVTALAALTIIGLALLALAGALAIVAALPTANALTAALALSAVMLALSASLLIISNMSGKAAVGAAALLIVAAALAILTPCLQTLGGMSLAQIGVGLLALAGALAVIGIAGALLSPAAVGLLALGGAVALIGAGMLMAGVGVSLFASALNQFLLTAIAVSGQGPVIAAGITAMIQGICLAIVGSVSAITAAITAIIVAITQALITSVPAILNCLNIMITSFLSFLVSVIPKFVVAGMQIIQGILQGIADNIGGIIDAAADIIVNFLDGISRNLPRIIDSGIKLVISFINGMANGIRNNKDSMISAVNNLMDAVMDAIKSWFSNSISRGKELVGKLISGVKSKFGDMKSAAKNMMDGFIKGVGEKFGAIKKKAVDAVSGAVDAVKNFLGIKSPSRLFAEIGRYTDEGFIAGIQQYSKDVYNAGVGLGQSVNDGVTDALDINSPAKVMIENGKYVVQGIAEGIKSDMSAEEAASQKAKNISDAFNTEFNKIDLDMNTIDLEHKLWESQNGETASEADKISAELSILAKKIAEQKKKVELAQGEYQVTIAEFGKEAEQTQEAYNKYLKQQTELVNYENDVVDKRKSLIAEQRDLDLSIIEAEYELWTSRNESATENEKLMAESSYLNKKIAMQTTVVNEAQEEYNKALSENGAESTRTKELYVSLLAKQNELESLENELFDLQNTGSDPQEQADSYYAQQKKVAAYHQYLKDYKESLLAIGLTMDDITAAAEKASGWSPNSGVISSSSLSDSQAGSALLTNYGTEVAASVGTGIRNGESQVSDAMGSMMNSCVDQINSKQVEWKQAGEFLVIGFINGIRDNIEAAAKAAADMARAAYVAAKEEFDINSPSRAFEEIGMYVDEGFAKGVSKYATVAKKAVVDMSKDTVEAVKNPLSRIMDLINGDLDTTPTIRPVLDLSEIQNGTQRINGMFGQRSVALAGINARIANTEIMSRSNDPGNSDIVNAITELRGDFGNLANAVGNMQISMDGKTVVGTIINRIDSQLGQIVSHKGRGN